MKEIFNKPYIYYLFLVFFIYIFIDILISGFYDTIPLILIYANTVNWFTLGFSLLLTLSIGVLVALNSILLYLKFKERKKCKKEITINSIGGIGGLVTGVCPLCITGIVPLILGFIGISFSLASLPFGGVEIQVLVVIILLINFISLNKN